MQQNSRIVKRPFIALLLNINQYLSEDLLLTHTLTNNKQKLQLVHRTSEAQARKSQQKQLYCLTTRIHLT